MVSIILMSFSNFEGKIEDTDNYIIKIDLNTIKTTKLQDDWGPWTTATCFRGLDFRVRRGHYYESLGKYNWQLQFRNRYNESMYLQFEMVEPEREEEIKNSGKTTNGTTIAANTTESSEPHWDILKAASNIYVYVNKVRFGNSREDADCDQ